MFGGEVSRSKNNATGINNANRIKCLWSSAPITLRLSVFPPGLLYFEASNLDSPQLHFFAFILS